MRSAKLKPIILIFFASFIGHHGLSEEHGNAGFADTLGEVAGILESKCNSCHSPDSNGASTWGRETIEKARKKIEWTFPTDEATNQFNLMLEGKLDPKAFKYKIGGSEYQGLKPFLKAVAGSVRENKMPPRANKQIRMNSREKHALLSWIEKTNEKLAENFSVTTCELVNAEKAAMGKEKRVTEKDAMRIIENSCVHCHGHPEDRSAKTLLAAGGAGGVAAGLLGLAIAKGISSFAKKLNARSEQPLPPGRESTTDSRTMHTPLTEKCGNVLRALVSPFVRHPYWMGGSALVGLGTGAVLNEMLKKIRSGHKSYFDKDGEIDPEEISKNPSILENMFSRVATENMPIKIQDSKMISDVLSNKHFALGLLLGSIYTDQDRETLSAWLAHLQEEELPNNCKLYIPSTPAQSYSAAAEECSRYGMRMPTIDQLETISNQIQQTKQIETNNCIWSTTIGSNAENPRQVFFLDGSGVRGAPTTQQCRIACIRN